MADQDPTPTGRSVRCRPSDLVDEPLGAAHRRSADHAESAALRDGGRQFGGCVAASHGHVEDRVHDSGEIADPSVNRRCGFSDRPLLRRRGGRSCERDDTVASRSACRPAPVVSAFVSRVCRKVQALRRARPSLCFRDSFDNADSALCSRRPCCRKGGVSRYRHENWNEIKVVPRTTDDRGAVPESILADLFASRSGRWARRLHVLPIERGDAEHGGSPRRRRQEVVADRALDQSCSCPGSRAEILRQRLVVEGTCATAIDAVRSFVTSTGSPRSAA